ncbi:carbohydrate kinase family protein [Mesorhizobium xinjiangense]|uniref:carbohydrate kinase family protein n=1 Tax=Mesorhizobium xinjiangense TaxID=2678685 RepID=UPI0012ED66B6|nr:carbohydrate kinase [Mesorhizobium xinjiangense]
MILCCGEALIDMLPHHGEDDETCYLPHVGGAVFNTAIALGRLGIETGFFSGLSNDHFGEILRNALKASGVGLAHVHFADRPTTLAFVRLVEGQASYVFYDENTAGRMLEERDLPALDDTVEALHFGAISLISEPCGSTYETLMAREHENRIIMLDPNIRPGFIADAQAHKARIRRMAAMSDIVKFSDEDLRWLKGGDDIEAAAREYLADGARIVLVTRGAQGAIAMTRDIEVSVPAEIVKLVDTVGAGDTFNAGILAALKEQNLLDKSALARIDAKHLSTALAFGAKVAGVTVSRAGANPPWRGELE